MMNISVLAPLQICACIKTIMRYQIVCNLCLPNVRFLNVKSLVGSFISTH